MAVKKVMKIHPLCAMFRKVAPLTKAEQENMLKSIKDHGVEVPILVNRKKDTILDGYTRWTMAHDAKLKLTDDNFEVFPSDDEEEIKQVIARRNLDRRHLSDDQRMAVISQMFGEQLTEDAKARQSKAGSFKGSKKLDGKGSVAEELAKLADSTPYKAKQAEKARKAGLLSGVLDKSTTLNKAARKAGPSKKKKPVKKVVAFEDGVYARWIKWLNHYPHPKRAEVCQLVVGWVGDKTKTK